MSATLDGDAVAGLLGGAPVVSSEGRQFPVQTLFTGAHELRDPIEPVTVTTVMRALAEREGNILVFLPGQREIHRVGRELARRLEPAQADRIQICPLYGGLPLKQQRQAIAPPAAGERKIVLSTNLAETSLTIPGAFLLDVLAFLAVGASMLYLFLRSMGKYSIYPARDPRLLESARLVN